MNYTEQDMWFRYWMPYTFTKLEIDGVNFKHVYLPLNRNYKPLGCFTSSYVDYYDYRNQCMRFIKNPNTLSGVWWNNAPLFLYNDGDESRETYFKRLGKVLQYTKIIKGLD